MGSIQIRLLHPIKFISLNWNLQNLVKLYDPLQYAKDEWMYMSYPYPFNSLSINSIIIGLHSCFASLILKLCIIFIISKWMSCQSIVKLCIASPEHRNAFLLSRYRRILSIPRSMYSSMQGKGIKVFMRMI